MAFKAGKGAFISLDNVAGSPVDVSAYADSFGFPRNTDPVEVTTFGDSNRDFVVGLAGGDSVAMSGPLDVALGTFVQLVNAAQTASPGSSTSTLLYGPGGSVAGQISRSIEVWVTAFDINTNADGRAEYSCSLQTTGALTAGTF